MIDYQRVIAEINLDNIEHNIREIRKHIGNSTKIMAIVKADAYGHGAVEVSKVCLYGGADWLGIAVLEEGIELRRNNIYVPILILGYTIESKIEDVINYNLTQTVFDFETAQKISKAAVKLNKVTDIHIKIDTGMGRIGFSTTQSDIEEIIKIKNLPNINITGVFTHFATSDEADKSFTFEQYNKFCSVCSELEKQGLQGFIKHAANSGAIIDLKELSCDMVRAGIITYGLFPSENVNKNILDLKSAMSLKTHVSFVKTVPENFAVSYGRTFYTSNQSKIATIPVGYADGYSRIMSNKARVIVNGEYADVIGNICMDQFMADVSCIEDVQAGDEVILLGEDVKSGKSVTADEIATLQQSINYEVVCSIGKRIPRVYLRNGNILKTISYNI